MLSLLYRGEKINTVVWLILYCDLRKDVSEFSKTQSKFGFSLCLSILQCEWLLGDRKPSPEDMDKGIDTNSPLFQAILENPVVQLGLTNPKTLLGTV